MKLRHIIGAVLCMAVAGPSFAQGSHMVRGHVRKDGTYVAPHMRTNPNSTRLDNWSTRGNVNPHTGEEGTKDPYEGTSSRRSSGQSKSSTSTNGYPN